MGQTKPSKATTRKAGRVSSRAGGAPPSGADRRKTRRPMDRDAMIEAVLDRVACGATLSHVCRDGNGEGLPSYMTIYRWMAEVPDLARRLMDARMMGAMLLAESCIDIADACQPDRDEVALAKLRCDMRWRLAARWAPARLGTTQQVEDAQRRESSAVVSDGPRYVVLEPRPEVDVSADAHEAAALDGGPEPEATPADGLAVLRQKAEETLADRAAVATSEPQPGSATRRVAAAKVAQTGQKLAELLREVQP